MRSVVLASHNAKKLEEIRRMLEPLVPGIELLGYEGPEPIENGVTFEDNALLKARAAADHTGLAAIADDSGIAVDVLGGSPGIFSARWSGPERSDEGNVSLLLWQLTDIADEYRGAAFVCAAALAFPGDRSRDIVRRGEWRGQVLRHAAGSGGFGYDPVFQPEGESRSAAQLSAAEKDALSHRRRAFTALAPELQARLS